MVGWAVLRTANNNEKLTTKLNVFAVCILEWHRSEPSSQTFDRNGVLADEVRLAEHVHVVNDEPWKEQLISQFDIQRVKTSPVVK